MPDSIDFKRECIESGLPGLSVRRQCELLRLWRTVKYEYIYLHDHATPRALEAGLAGYFPFYNDNRLHAALDYLTPAIVYAAA